MRIISLSFFNDTWIHSYPEFLLYKNLKEKFKADIDVVNCSKFFFSACTAHSMKQIPINGEKKIKDKVCETCIKTTNFYNNNSSNSSIGISDYINKNDISKIKKILKETNIKNFENLKVFGVNVGKSTLFNFLIMNKLNSYLLNNTQFKEFKIYLENSLKVLFAFRKIVKKKKYDILIAYSVEYSYNKVCAEYAEQNNIKIFSIVGGQNPYNKYSNLFLLSDANKLGFAYHVNKFFPKFRNKKIKKSDLKHIEGYVNSLLNSNSYLNFSLAPRGTNIREYFKISKKYKKIVLVAMAGAGERLGDHLSGYIQSKDKKCYSKYFPDDLEWIKYLMKNIKNIKDTFFIFRPHPRDYLSRNHSIESSVLKGYKLLNKKKPNNCAFNFQEDNISIYDFIPEINLLLNSSSVTSYEFGLFGIRTLVYDPNLYYYPNDLVIYPKNFKDYIPILKKTLNESSYNKKKVVLNAFKFMSLRFNYEEIDISDVLKLNTMSLIYRFFNRMQRYLGINFFVNYHYYFKNTNIKNINLFHQVLKNNHSSVLDLRIKNNYSKNKKDDGFFMVKNSLLNQLKINKKNILYNYVKNEIN